MKIVGIAGAILGFIIGLLLLSFIICMMILSGEIEHERERQDYKKTKR